MAETVSDQSERAGFADLVRIKEIGADRWCAATPGPAGLPLGLMGARALVAAGHTLDTDWRWVHSVHLSQVAEAGPADQERYLVERTRDDEYLSTREVRIGRNRPGQTAALATATVSFQVPRRGTGPSYQAAQPAELPDPHGLPRERPVGPVEMRRLGPGRQRGWVRVTEELPDRILPHTAALVYATDLVLAAPGTEGYLDLDTGCRLRPVVLDRTLRVHRSFRADDWVQYEHESASAADYRAYATARFYSSMGRLIASVSQETALVPDLSLSAGRPPREAARSAMSV